MRARGFTLVEVMVALAIVAIALPAVLVALYQQIDDTAYLRDKTMAAMVAANKLAEMRLVIASTRVLKPGKANGVAQMAEREWHWWVETKLNNPQLPKFLRIEIRVALEEERQGERPPKNPLYTLTTFMSSDLKVDTTASEELGGGGGGGETSGEDGGDSGAGGGQSTTGGGTGESQGNTPAVLKSGG